MSTTITKRPEQKVEGNYDSHWVAIGHPSNKALFQFQRKDTGVLSVIESNDGKIICRGTSTVLDVPVGSRIYIRYGTRTESRTGVVTGTSSTVLGKDIITDIDYEESVISISSNYANITSNDYLLTVRLYNADTNKLINTSTHESSPIGIINYDAGPYLRSKMKVKCELDDTLINESDKNLSIPFYITYQVTYLEEEETLISDSDNVYTGVFASMRVTDRWGQMMGQQTAFDANLIEKNKAWFTTRFQKPCYFPGYPFDLGLMYTGETIPYKEEVYRDVNGEVIGGDSRILDEDEDYRYLQRIAIKKGYLANTKEVDIYLSQDGLEIGCLALDVTDFFVNWVLNESDELQFIDLTIETDEQVLSIDDYPDALLFNNLGVLVETIPHAGSGRYTPSSTHTIDTGVWTVRFTDVMVTLRSGDTCDISFENEYDSSWCGIDYDAIDHDLIVYPN